MFTAWRLGKLFGIDINLHWSFLLLPLWVFLSTQTLFAVGLVLALFGCVVLHELGHALTARSFGIGTRDITLYPIGGVARLDGMTNRPWEEFWIAVAGPAVNVVIAGALFLVLSAAAVLNPASVGTLGTSFVSLLMLMNVAMVVFNMIPAFPMDGGRVLRACLSQFMGQLRATRIAANVAVVFAILIALVGVFIFGNFWTLFIALFVFLAGQAELRAVEMRERLRFEQASFDGSNFFRNFGPYRTQGFYQEPKPQPNYDDEDDTVRRPSVSVYVWDNDTNGWVKQRSGV